MSTISTSRDRGESKSIAAICCVYVDACIYRYRFAVLWLVVETDWWLLGVVVPRFRRSLAA